MKNNQHMKQASNSWCIFGQSCIEYPPHFCRFLLVWGPCALSAFYFLSSCLPWRRLLQHTWCILVWSEPMSGSFLCCSPNQWGQHQCFQILQEALLTHEGLLHCLINRTSISRYHKPWHADLSNLQETKWAWVSLQYLPGRQSQKRVNWHRLMLLTFSA